MSCSAEVCRLYSASLSSNFVHVSVPDLSRRMARLTRSWWIQPSQESVARHLNVPRSTSTDLAQPCPKMASCSVLRTQSKQMVWSDCVHAETSSKAKSL